MKPSAISQGNRENPTWLQGIWEYGLKTYELFAALQARRDDDNFKTPYRNITDNMEKSNY